MTAPGNYPALQSSGLAVIPIEHQSLLSAGLREKERGVGVRGGIGPYKDWLYQGTIAITNPVATANYQHYLSLSWKPGMQFDFRDIRFTQQDGTICPYWIETYTSKTSATVWIKVPSANQRQIILYYGNPHAASESSGSLVFDFFDDFPGSSLDTTKWTAVSGTWAVSNGICTNVDSGTRGVLNATGAPTADNYIMRAKYRTTSQGGIDSASSISVRQANSNPSYAYSAACRVSSGNPIVWVEQFVAWLTQISSLTWADDIWMTNEIVHDGTNVKFRKNDGTWYNWTKSGRSGYLGFQNARSSSETQTMEIDWALVRKYSAIEPTLTLKQYGPRPDAQIIYYPFLPSPIEPLPSGVFLDELIEFSQTITGVTPIVDLGHLVTLSQTMAGVNPITDYYPAAITPAQTARAKVFAKLFLDLSRVRVKTIRISKSIQDTLWRADIDLHQYKNMDMTVLRHCTYATTDHLGASHTLFTGILPGAQPQLAPADETTRITGYDYGWYLTQRKVPEAYLHNTAATNPTAVIRGLLGGDDWMTETGIEPYSIQTVSEWGDTLNRKVFDFDRTTSRLQAIQRICDYCRYVFIVKWRDIGGGILNPCAYFCHEDDIDTYLDLPSEVTFTKPDPYVEEKIIWDVKGDERFNRVTVYGRKSDGTSISYTAETADATNGDEIPVEFVESSGAFTTEAQVQARAEELLTYFSTTQKTYTVTLNLRTDLELLQKVKFVGWSEIPEDTMRIIAISYTIDDATATKRVEIQVTNETKLSQIRRMYRSMSPDPLSEAEALFDAKAATMPGNDVGTITAIDEETGTATVQLEDGRIVTARII